MSQALEVRVPDIGDFTDVSVIEIHVSVGDEVSIEDPLVTLESDKATMDVPAPSAGTVAQVCVKVGDRVSEGSLLVSVEARESPSAAPVEHAAPTPGKGAAATPTSPDVQLVVIGAGIGGYTAAFRAADLGLRTILVERHERLGGVCLNVGCIPSKTLLHAARVIAEAEALAEHGVSFAAPKVDIEKLVAFKQSVVDRLTGGLAGLARQRKVEVARGTARFRDPHSLRIGERELSFEHCIIAAGSRPAMLPDLPQDPRIMDSTAALAPQSVPRRLLVVGGGIIGLEMATVYDALGSRVSVVELLDQLIPGCDEDLVKPLRQRIERRYEQIRLGTSVERVEAQKSGLKVTFSSGETERFDQVLIATGRRPNGDQLEVEAAGVQVDERGFIAVDRQLRTNVAHIHAIGDIVGGPMLAHKASHEGKIAAEVLAGDDVRFDAQTIPSVAYTDPEIAWMGLTETAARSEGIEVQTSSFPWAASGRALSLGRPDGLTKLLFEPGSGRLLGAGIVGAGAGELIAEAVLALEMGANAEDLALTIHPHPTLTETIGFAAELQAGTITDLMPRRRARADSAGV